MSLPGLLIEYLVIGSLALPWLLRLFPVEVSQLPGAAFPVVAAYLYFTGMVVDVVAFFALRPLKWTIRRLLAERHSLTHDAKPGAATRRLIRLMQKSKTLSDEAAARSSRDRIARGAVVNAVVASFFYSGSTRLVCVAAALGALAMWFFFESQSHTFDLNAERELGLLPPAAGAEGASRSGP